MSNSNRIESLDSLRGLAALTVVFHHCLLMLPQFLAITLFWSYPLSTFDRVFSYSPLHILWDGHSAVIMFFVLSGFVLALPYMDARQTSYWRFLVRRVCRIYIPYIVVMAVAAVLVLNHLQCHQRPPFNNLSSWFLGNWTPPMNWAIFGQLALMSGNHINLDNVVWSLVHEMRISIVFPLIAWFIKRARWYYSAFFALIALEYGKCLMQHYTGAALAYQLPQTVYYTTFFVLGAMLAKYRMSVKEWTQRHSRFNFVCFGIAAILLYCWTWIAPAPMSATSYGPIPIDDFMTGLASMMFISIALSSKRTQSALSFRPIAWLGKVSYSLYLVHLLVIMSVVYDVGSALPLKVEMIIIVPIAFVAAAVTYYLVERPSMLLGRFLTKRTKVPDTLARTEAPVA